MRGSSSGYERSSSDGTTGGRKSAIMRHVTVLLVTGERRGKVLKSRQAAVWMLIVIVITFALCNLPCHLRKMCEHYVPNFNIQSTVNQLITPATHRLMYTNSALNPILYAFMSSFKGLLRLKRRRKAKSIGVNPRVRGRQGTGSEKLRPAATPSRSMPPGCQARR